MGQDGPEGSSVASRQGWLRGSKKTAPASGSSRSYAPEDISATLVLNVSREVWLMDGGKYSESERFGSEKVAEIDMVICLPLHDLFEALYLAAAEPPR